MKNIGIVGASGYTGIELIRLLVNHPQIKITRLFAHKNAGKLLKDIYPFLTGICDLELEAFSIDKTDDLDLIFLALPHGEAHKIVPQLLEKKVKIIDLSPDFRITDISLYERTYQIKHTAPSYMQFASHGFSELFPDDIALKPLCANPGCYVTSVVLGLYPLVKQGLINKPVLIDAKSGVSGAGRTLKETALFCEVNENFTAYQTFTHRHAPEMENILDIKLLFSPHLIPMNRGILSAIYIDNEKNLTLNQLIDLFQTFYKNKPFVKILFNQERPSTNYAKGSNFCFLFLNVYPELNKIVIFSTIDNLIKGASGQAIQNMNIMLGFDETLGLLNIPNYL